MNVTRTLQTSPIFNHMAGREVLQTEKCIEQVAKKIYDAYASPDDDYAFDKTVVPVKDGGAQQGRPDISLASQEGYGSIGSVQLYLILKM